MTERQWRAEQAANTGNWCVAADFGGGVVVILAEELDEETAKLMAAAPEMYAALLLARHSPGSDLSQPVFDAINAALASAKPGEAKP